MYKFILGVLLLPALAYAQPVTVEKPVVCEKIKIVIETLTGSDYKEMPFWFGENETSQYAMLVNEKTKTWSFIQFNKDKGVACVIDTGTNHQRVFLKPGV